MKGTRWIRLALCGFVELGPTVILLGLATLGATILASAAGIWLYSKVGAPSPPDLSAT